MQVSREYPADQLARALITAAAQENASTRRRAAERVQRWQQVLDGMAGGQVKVGSRTPMTRMPAWVTPEVIRGGFATGVAAAGGELLPYELETAERAQIPASRAAIFGYYLTEQGLAELGVMLDSRRYTLEVPEEAALLTVAWLARAGDRTAALDLLDTLAPFTGRLRFAPRPALLPRPEARIVWRENVGQVAAAVRRRAPNPRLATMNEALTVWSPFADELLELWLETCTDGIVAQRMSAEWRGRAVALLGRYVELAARYRRCAKHRRPKENLAILRTSLEDVVAHRGIEHGLLQQAVDSMVRRRGRPGTAEHTALRREQSAQGSRPTHHAIGQVVLSRLAATRQDAGLLDPDAVLGAVETVGQDVGPLDPAAVLPTAEAIRDRTGGAVPREIPVPPSLRRVVRRACAATIEELVAAGRVPSAEVLAELIPATVAATSAAAYPDAALRTLVAAGQQAFSARRSLLLLNLEHQVRAEEVPWLRAVLAHRRPGGGGVALARTVLRQIGTLAITAYPATILPNPLVRELAVLAKAGLVDVPLVEELAADIFMGEFSATFRAAAAQAGRLLGGSLYQRYYGIDYPGLTALWDAEDHRTNRRKPLLRKVSEANWFYALCAERAGLSSRDRGVTANGQVIEQAQILTSHNLAAVVSPIGVVPEAGWPLLARSAFDTVSQLIGRAQLSSDPRRMIKDAGYGWRQMLFFLSMGTEQDQAAFLAWAQDQMRTAPGHLCGPLGQVLGGLEFVLAGGSFAAGAQAADRRPFLGWVAGRHWLLASLSSRGDVVPHEGCSEVTDDATWIKENET